MTDIVISIDLEFDLNHAFERPGATPLGVASIRDRDRPDLGLDAILDPVERHGFRAVFFVEVANLFYFGDEEMGAIARELHERGHELQLHIHPVWRLFTEPDWRQRVGSAPPASNREDNFGLLSADESAKLLEHGIAAFARWGVPRPCAFRSGNLMIGAANYRAMKRTGIELSSSLGRHGREGEPGFSWRTMDEIDGVLEIPVTRYEELVIGSLRRERSFTLTGSSRTALRQVLRRALDAGVSPVMLLTHAAEFMPAASSTGIARTNAKKFAGFCDHLAAHRDSYSVVTIAERLDDWREQLAARGPLQLPVLRGLQSVFDRVIELKIEAA